MNVNLICLSWLNTKYLNTCTIIPILLWKHVTSRNRSSQIHPIYHIEYYQKIFLFSSLIICFYHELIYNYFAVFIKNKVAALNFLNLLYVWSSACLTKESSFRTTMHTLIRRVRWLQLPFGINSATEEFQRRREKLLKD